MSLIRLLFSLIFILLTGFSCLTAQDQDKWKGELEDPDESIQIDALHHLSIAYNRISLDSALLFGRKSLALSRVINHDSLEAISHSRLSVTFYYQRQLDSLIEHAQAGGQLAEQLGMDKLLAFCLKIEAIGHKHQGGFENAIECNRKGLTVYEALNDTIGIAGTYANTGAIHQQMGKYDLALQYFLKAENLFETINDLDGRGVTAAQIGDLYLDMKKTNKGVFYTRKALQLTPKDSIPIRYADLLNSLGTIYHLDENQLDSAMFCFTESLKIYDQIGDKEGAAIAHTNLGNIYGDKKDWNNCFHHLHASKSIATLFEWNKNIASVYSSLGTSHELTGQLDSAEYYFLNAYDITQKESIPFEEENILEKLYIFYKKNHQSKEALHFHELYSAHINKIKGKDVQKEIAALEAQYESEKQARKIERLELQSTIEASKTNAFKIGLLGLAIISSLIIIGILYRRKNEQKLYSLQQQMHEQEKKELDQELSYKTKQLTSHALHMVQKNKVLQEIKQGIGDLTQSVDAIHKKALRSLMRRIDFNIQSDEDWDTFKLYFEQTNEHFYQNLAKINKDLTSTELKLCSLIKLNMNIKETASVLNIEPTSVKTARHRLRKKLNLVQGQDLTTFIRQVA